jgi:hypothetical protein
VIAALRASCDPVEESSKMRAKVRVLSRIWKLLKNMKKVYLVPGRGLEPPRSYPLVPETSASTNFATRAGQREGDGRPRNVRTGSGAVN